MNAQITDEEIALRLAVALVEKEDAIAPIEAMRLYHDCLEALGAIYETRRLRDETEQGRPRMMADEEIAGRLAVALIEKGKAVSTIEAARLYHDCLEALGTICETRRLRDEAKP
jgi:predicted HTH domain antitoxin